MDIYVGGKTYFLVPWSVSIQDPTMAHTELQTYIQYCIQKDTPVCA